MSNTTKSQKIGMVADRPGDLRVEIMELSEKFATKGKELLQENQELADAVKTGASKINDFVSGEIKKYDGVKKALKEGSLMIKDVKSQLLKDERVQEVVDEGQKMLSDVLQDEDARTFFAKTATLLKSAEDSQILKKGLNEGVEYLKTLHGTYDPQLKDLLAEDRIQSLQEDASRLYEKYANLSDEELKSVQALTATSSISPEALAGDLKTLVVSNKTQWAEQGLELIKHVRDTNLHKEIIKKGITYVDQINEEGLDNVVEDLLVKGKELVHNKEKRDLMVEEIKNKAVDYLMEVVPKIKAPPITGTHDGYLEYEIVNVDFSGFFVSRSSVHVNLDFIQKASSEDPLNVAACASSSLSSQPAFANRSLKLVLTASNIKLTMKAVQWKLAKTTWPRLSSKGLMNCSTTHADFSAILFLENLNLDEGKPQLKLIDPKVVISDLELNFEGSALSWLYTTIASLFEDMLIDALEDAAVNKLTEKSDELLMQVNDIISEHLPLIRSIAGKHQDTLSSLDRDFQPISLKATV